MNIIFGISEAEELKKKYIVLELDTITIRSSKPITVYTVIENMPLDQLPKAEKYIDLHSNLMENYRKRNWDFCLQAITQLLGFWGGQADSFYEVLSARIMSYLENEPDDLWTGVIAKS